MTSPSDMTIACSYLASYLLNALILFLFHVIDESVLWALVEGGGWNVLGEALVWLMTSARKEEVLEVPVKDVCVVEAG